MNEQQTLAKGAPASFSRRRFLGYAGALAGASIAAGMIGCKKEEDPMAGAIDLGQSDIGVLNLFYVMAQLQAAFYTQVVKTPYDGLKVTDTDYKMLSEMRDHELAHREFYRKLITVGAVQDLTPEFGSIDFAKRTDVLQKAMFFEDLSVSAYNGNMQLLSQDIFVLTAGKVVSVEARHSAAVRNMIEMGTFADDGVADPQNGQDLVRNATDVLMLAGPYFKELLNPKNLPTS